MNKMYKDGVFWLQVTDEVKHHWDPTYSGTPHLSRFTLFFKIWRSDTYNLRHTVRVNLKNDIV
jgi:hypothetical protein